MTTKLIILGFIGLAVIVGGCSKQSPLQTPAEALGTSTSTSLERQLALPAKTIIGHFDTVIETFIPIEFVDGQPVKFTMHIVGQGFVTPLGACTVAFDQVADYAASPITLVAPEVVITDSNGDELYLDSRGTASDDPTNPTFSGKFKFYGGTGQYEDSKGQAKFIGSANIATMTGEFSFEGKIHFEKQPLLDVTSNI